MTEQADWTAPEREARLRPEFAGHYAGLEPGVWLPAAGVVDFILARARTANRPNDPQQRSLDPEHFEFRGGRPRSGPHRSRATDN